MLSAVDKLAFLPIAEDHKNSDIIARGWLQELCGREYR